MPILKNCFAALALGGLLLIPFMAAQADPDLTRPLSPAKLSHMSAQKLGLLRNEIYARHGYHFTGKSPRSLMLQKHFTGLSWYHPDTSDSTVVQARLSPVERRNVDLLVLAERGKPMASLPSATRVHHHAPASSAEDTYAQDEASAMAPVKARLERDYPDSYSTQKMLLDGEVEAYHYMLTVPEDNVKQRLERDYPDSYSTQKMLYEGEMQSKKELGR